MSKRSFLKPLSMILAALTSAAATGSTRDANDVPPTAALEPETTGSAPASAAQQPIQPGTERRLTFSQDGELFGFVLARGQKGEYIARHYSHESHSSHSSHVSHQSHYSSRY